MLGGDGEPAGARLVAGKPVFQHVGLLDDLPRVGEQLRALVRKRHAAVRAREDGDVELVLELLHGDGEVGLRCVDVVCGGADGARLCDRDEISQLLKRHVRSC